jgi:hypothetical protein
MGQGSRRARHRPRIDADEYLVQGAKAAIACDWTTNSDRGNWFILVFKPAGGVTPPTPGFSAAVDRKQVTVTDTSSAGTNPITSREYDYGDGTGRTSSTTHLYSVGGTYTVTQYVNDGVTAEQSTTHSVTTKTRERWRVQTVGGLSATVTADRPDA